MGECFSQWQPSGARRVRGNFIQEIFMRLFRYAGRWDLRGVCGRCYVFVCILYDKVNIIYGYERCKICVVLFAECKERYSNV